jgi:hypothetical protein
MEGCLFGASDGGPVPVTAPGARYLIELTNSGARPLYLGQRAHGVIFWTTSHDEAKGFGDAGEAQRFADANVAGTVRIIRDPQWATSSR